MRGRLIQKFVVVITRLDTAATAAVVDGGYDPDFNEPLPVDDGTQLGASSRRYHPEITLKCQLDRSTWGDREHRRSGVEIKADIVIVLHWPELVRKSLVNAKGEPMFAAGDKIVRIETTKGALTQEFRDPPGMFITDLTRAGHGLAAFATSKTNLLYVFCSYDEKVGAE